MIIKVKVVVVLDSIHQSVIVVMTSIMAFWTRNIAISNVKKVEHCFIVLVFMFILGKKQ